MNEFSPIVVKVSRSSLSIAGCPKELADALQFQRLDITHSGGNFVTSRVPVSYASYDERSHICRTYPNALHLVKKHAAAIHQNIAVDEQRTFPNLNLSVLDRSQYRSVCFEALEAVSAARSSGLIIGPAGIGKTSIICGLIQMLPKDFKVLVTTEDRNVALQLHKALSEAIPGEKIGLHCKPVSEIGRITATHLDALKDFTQGVIAYSGYDLRSFDCWICDEVHRLPVPSRLPFLPQFRPVCSWGLTATPERADNSHTLNEVVFGPALFSINHKETLDIQAKTGEKGIVPVKVLVFPLVTGEPVPDDIPLFSKIRKVYLKNPKIRQLLIGILSSIPDLDTAKIMIFVDTRRLGVLIGKWMPGFTFVHGLHSLDYRQNVLDKFKTGELTKIICTDIWSEGIDVPDLTYVVDCSAKVSPNRIIQRAGRAARSAGDKAAGYYIMVISTTSPHLFNQGITKLKSLNDLGWEIRYMFDRDYAKTLPFEKAPLLAELGQFSR